MTNKIYGISAFGFNDSICQDSGSSIVDSSVIDRPVCVVTERIEGRSSRILTGAKADKSRVQSGFHWPPESRLPVFTKSFVPQRLPVGLLWERLANCKDSISLLGNYQTSDLLRAHIDNLCPQEDDAMRILAIPNSLTTATRERLLRSFDASKNGSLKLIWRPVAAVLGWLRKMSSESISIQQNDWVGVCYLGIDGVEFTRVKLSKLASGHIVPTRSRPKRSNSLDCDGFDIAQSFGNAPQQNWKSRPLMWQGLLRTSDAWDWVLGHNSKGTPVLWSQNCQWTIQRSVFPENEYSEMKPSQFWTQELSGRTSDNWKKYHSWQDFLLNRAKQSFESSSALASCRGIIVCGGLAPAINSCPKWLSYLSDALSLHIKHGCSIDSVCLPDDDLISLGAFEYGRRLLADEPTYNDVLPQIQLFVIKDSELVWQNLFDVNECEGGKTAQNELRVFSLKANSTTVEIWLQMSEEEIDDDQQELKPYRFSRVAFKKSYPEDIRLILSAKMQPSSGYASVTFKPEDQKYNDILNSGGVYLNFDDMEPKNFNELPEIKRSYPPDGRRELITNNDKPKMIQNESFWDNFDLRIQYYLIQGDHDSLAKYLRSRMNVKVAHGTIDNLMKNNSKRDTYHYVINEIGESNLLDVNAIGMKVSAMAAKDPHWLKVGGWLWNGCPKDVKNLIFASITKPVPAIFNIGYAARVSNAKDEYEKVINATRRYLNANRTYQGVTITPNLARSLVWMFDLKKQSIKSLTPYSAKELLFAIENAINQEIEKPIYEVKVFNFQWLPNLLAVLLKYRQKDRNFLTSQDDIEHWSFLLDSMKKRLEQYKTQTGTPNAIRIEAILDKWYEAIKDYLKGCGNNVPLLDESE